MQSPYGVVETSAEKIKSFIEKPLVDYYINASTGSVGSKVGNHRLGFAVR